MEGEISRSKQYFEQVLHCKYKLRIIIAILFYECREGGDKDRFTFILI